MLLQTSVAPAGLNATVCYCSTVPKCCYSQFGSVERLRLRGWAEHRVEEAELYKYPHFIHHTRPLPLISRAL